jgi:hypothetical protein
MEATAKCQQTQTLTEHTCSKPNAGWNTKSRRGQLQKDGNISLRLVFSKYEVNLTGFSKHGGKHSGSIKTEDFLTK